MWNRGQWPKCVGGHWLKPVSSFGLRAEPTEASGIPFRACVISGFLS